MTTLRGRHAQDRPGRQSGPWVRGLIRAWVGIGLRGGVASDPVGSGSDAGRSASGWENITGRHTERARNGPRNAFAGWGGMSVYPGGMTRLKRLKMAFTAIFDFGHNKSPVQIGSGHSKTPATLAGVVCYASNTCASISSVVPVHKQSGHSNAFVSGLYVNCTAPQTGQTRLISNMLFFLH